MVYDDDGNRVSETAGGVTTTYLVDTLNLTGYSHVLDELVSGSVTKTYTYGLQRISENQLSGSTWTPTFYGYDGHGNVRFLTSTTGTLGNTYQFDAFGMSVASTGTTANSYTWLRAVNPRGPRSPRTGGEWMDGCRSQRAGRKTRD